MSRLDSVCVQQIFQVRVNYLEWRLFARYIPRDVSGKEPTFEVINFLSKNLRFSYTKDFYSLHIHGLYLYKASFPVIAKTDLQLAASTCI